MTIDQYLRDTYVGKKIQFYVCEERYEADENWGEYVIRKYSFRQAPGRVYKEWEKREKLHFRDVLITDKIVGITTKGLSRVFWQLETLTGITIDFRANMTFEILDGKS